MDEYDSIARIGLITPTNKGDWYKRWGIKDDDDFVRRTHQNPSKIIGAWAILRPIVLARVQARTLPKVKMPVARIGLSEIIEEEDAYEYKGDLYIFP